MVQQTVDEHRTMTLVAEQLLDRRAGGRRADVRLCGEMEIALSRPARSRSSGR